MEQRIVWRLAMATVFMLVFAGTASGTHFGLARDMGPGLPPAIKQTGSFDPGASTTLGEMLWPTTELRLAEALRPHAEGMIGSSTIFRDCWPGELCESSGNGNQQWETSLNYQSRQPLNSESLSDRAVGGPDEFGYRWDDGAPLNWIDASAGIDTGISNSVENSSELEIGFRFKYYETSYTHLYVSRHGFLAFTDRNLWRWQSRIPSPGEPNGVIAPNWAPINRVEGYVRYLRGGVAPNRWFVVEWNRAVGEADGPDEYTFEAILYENGDLLFQYGDMVRSGAYYCQDSGIEDPRGLDGFSITDFCNWILGWHAVSISRPSSDRRVFMWPNHQGQHAHASELVKYDLNVCNAGDFGVDTFDLDRASTWPLALYQADGVTPLTDTNGNSVVDTGPVPEGSCLAIMAHTLVPADADVGRSDLGIVTASSPQGGQPKSAFLQTAVPSDFAQAYRRGDDNAMSLYLAKPGWQLTRTATANNYFGYNLAVAETPAGTFVYAWERNRCLDDQCSVHVSEIEYSLLDQLGGVKRAPARLTDHSGAIVDTFEGSIAVAVAPNGRIGLLWRRYLWNRVSQQFNYNVFFAVLDAAGAVIVAPTNLTNNPAWGSWDSLNVPGFNRVLLVATSDNRFVTAWHQAHRESSGLVDAIYYAIRSADGGQVRGITPVTNDTPGESGFNGPVLASLANARFYLSWRRGEDQNDDILYAIFDSSGDVVKGITDLSQDETVIDWYNWDAVQLSNGRILAVWEAWGCIPGEWRPRLRFAVLDQNYNRIGEPKCLGKVDSSKWGDIGASVAADASGRGIITWIESGDEPRHLYYALVNSDGQILTPPMIFRGNQRNPVSILINYEGYGNTGFHWQPPDAVDGYLAAPSERLGARGGFAAIPITYGNNGYQWAGQVMLEATLANGLAYDSDTSGVAPTIAGNRLRWNLPGLGFLARREFTLYLRISGDSALGGRLSVDFSLSSSGPEVNPADNSAVTQVVVGQPLGGPDDFGYTWDDNAPFRWVDATIGTDTGITSTGLLDIGFPFKFHEQTWERVYADVDGFLAFGQTPPGCCRPPSMPLPTPPNNLIAAFWDSLVVGSDYNDGAIYSMRGGVAPNRYFVVEWHNVTRCCRANATDFKTFEIILHESGDITMQYQQMLGDLGWATVGIEDSDGDSGLEYTPEPTSNKAIRFSRPPAQARVKVFPLHQGSFTRSGEKNSFALPIRNSGDLGNDIYDLEVASGWLVSFYQADGVTPLIDSDADGAPDTQAVAPGATADVVVVVQTPGGVGVAAHNTAEVTVRSSLNPEKSKTVAMRTVVPAPFAQAYTDAADGALSLYLVQPAGRTVKKFMPDGSSGPAIAVAETPNRGFVYAWSEASCRSAPCTSIVVEIKYVFVDRYGRTISSIQKLVDHANATQTTIDWLPSLAVAPDGKVGVMWRRLLQDASSNRYNENMFFAVLDAEGNRVVAPINLTNNGDLSSSFDPRSSSVAVIQNGHFVLAWQKRSEEDGDPVDDIYYAIRDGLGQAVRETIRFTSDTPGWDEGYYYPRLASVGGDRTLLTWTQRSDVDIHFAVLDDSGNVVRPAANLVGDGSANVDLLADSVQMADGRTVVAWMASGAGPYRIRFAVLDVAFNRVAGPTFLDNPAALTGEGWVSVAATGSGAVLTWMDFDGGFNGPYGPNLYYALVDGNGHILTAPTIFRTSKGANPLLVTSVSGLGNTSYGWQPSGGVDGVVAFGWPKSGAEPGGAAAHRVSMTNRGATPAANVRLTLTLHPSLTYLSDTSGLTPTVDGSTVTWNSPELALLDERDFTLLLQTPFDAQYGAQYPITITLASAGLEVEPGNNTAAALVEAQRRVWLPLLIR